VSNIEKNVFLRAAILGAMSGMRSVAGSATITRRAAREPKGFEDTIFRLLTKRSMSGLATLGQVVEIVLDKLPILPARIAPLPLVGRVFYGGAAGAAAFAEARWPVIVGALLGAGAAVASAHVFYRLRVGASKGLHVSDPIVAIAEDGVVFALERVAMRTYE
jgi:uncharacterized membrane protein